MRIITVHLQICAGAAYLLHISLIISKYPPLVTTSMPLFLCSVEGTSDDLDEPIRRCFLDGELVIRHNLCSINSVNWARILVQLAHYFYTYLQVIFI